jgi:NTE family protein
MTQSSRRNFLKTSAISSVAIAGGSGVVIDYAQAQTKTSKFSIDQKAAEISKKLFSTDGLAIPIATKPTISKLATGLDRTMVLGGGGEYYIA